MSEKSLQPLRPTDEVHEEILERKPTQYTTVLKMLQIMLEKGL